MSNLGIIIEILSYSGPASNDPSDSCKIKNRTEDTNITDFSRIQTQIADGTTDQTISVPDSNFEYLAVFTDQEVSIKLNSGSESITLKPRAQGTKTFAFFNRGELSALEVSNSSGEIANLDIFMVNK